MIALGYVLGLLIGICLGMMGAGGAIMTIPVLVYLFDIDVVTSTFYSLFIVGITALIGTFGYLKNNLFDAKTVLFFGLPSILSVALTSKILMPSIPDVLFESENITVTKNLFIMFLFAVLMLLSAIGMLKSSKAINKEDYTGYARYRYGLIILQGLLVGLITGMLGAGGGFLIIPALVVLAHLPMKKAVGTSLCIISINCAIGFSTKYPQIEQVNWSFLLGFTSLTIAGIVSGILLSKRISGEKLKKGFAYFMLVMGTFILVKESVSEFSKKPNEKQNHNIDNIQKKE